MPVGKAVEFLWKRTVSSPLRPLRGHVVVQPLFVCLDYPRHYVHLFCHEGFVSVVYVFGGLVFHLAYEHSGGFYIRSLFRVAVGVASPVAVFGVADFVGQYAPVLGWGEVVRYVDGLGVRVVESLVPGLHRGDDDSFRVPPGFLL